MSALNVLPKTPGGYVHFPHGQNASSENEVMESHQINKEISSKIFWQMKKLIPNFLISSWRGNWVFFYL